MKGKRNRGVSRGREQFLGEIETEIVGTQYHETALTPGEHVNMEREPASAHDPNAIRVENGRFEPVGYLPRRMAAWIAPLVDAGKVRIEGYAPASGSPPEHDPGRRALVLMVFLGSKGRRLLEKSPPETKLDALHTLCQQAYKTAQGFSNPQLILDFASGIEPLGQQELLPETRLLLALIPGTAREIHAARSLQTQANFRATLDRLCIGQPMHHRNLTLFPLSWPEVQEPPYVLLCRAIELGTAVVEEVNQSGSVPNLRVTNKGLRPILVPEGDILIGAKQNRVVNVTVLVAAKSTFTLPVSCVEQGRWQYRSQAFRTGFSAPPRLRCKKTMSVQQNRRERGEANSDQGEVWDEVAMNLHAVHVASPTASLTDAMTGAAQRLEQYGKNLSLPEGASGVMVALGDRVVGMDLFDAPSTLAALWPRLADAYFFDALRERPAKQPTPEDGARRFLGSVASTARPRVPALGLGEELEISGDGVVGGALVYAGRICHLAGFSVES